MLYHKNENDAKQMAARLRISARRAVLRNERAIELPIGQVGSTF